MLELNVRAFGETDRPTIVLLHGLFGSSANWGSIARHLSADYRVLVPDLRNHGQSPHDAAHSYPLMVGDLLHLLDQNAVDSATLIGHSMGGKAAMHLALNHPQRVDGLAVLDMAPVSYTHDFDDVLAAFAAVDLDRVGKRTDADAQMASVIPHRGVRAFLLQNLHKGPDGWVWRANIEALAAAQEQITGFPQQAEDASFDGPCSFIHGELSDYVTPAYEPAIRALFPTAELCPVADAGHWVYAEQPQGFARCLDGFLSRLAH
jgi:pimeloyl-ACP methyl ester carboxylesterase